MTLVSIIVPTFNQEKYISECLDSILMQTYPDWECIVVNDGSTDETRSIVLSYIKKDSRISIIDQTNKGLSAARNTGLRHAKGHYIQFLDSDDAIFKNKLELQLSILPPSGGSVLSYTDYYYSTENDLKNKSDKTYISPRFTSPDYFYELISNWETKLSIPIHCFLFSSYLFKNNNIYFDKSLPNHEDWDCLLNIFRHDVTVFYVDKKLAIYRRYNNSMVSNKTSMKNGFINVIKKQLSYSLPDSIEYILLQKKRKQVIHLYCLQRLFKPIINILHHYLYMRKILQNLESLIIKYL